MPAYLIVNIVVRDTEKYREYVALAPAVVAQFGGRYLVRGGPVEILEGSPQVNRFVVIEFPSMQHIRDFYGSAEYRAILDLRLESTDSQMFCVEGFPGFAAR